MPIGATNATASYFGYGTSDPCVRGRVIVASPDDGLLLRVGDG